MSHGRRGGDQPPVLHRPHVTLRDLASPGTRGTHRQERTPLHPTLRPRLLALRGRVHQQEEQDQSPGHQRHGLQGQERGEEADHIP